MCGLVGIAMYYKDMFSDRKNIWAHIRYVHVMLFSFLIHFLLL